MPYASKKLVPICTLNSLKPVFGNFLCKSMTFFFVLKKKLAQSVYIPALLVLLFLGTLEETFLKLPKKEFVLSALGGNGGGVFPPDKSESSSPISSTYSESFTGFNKISAFPS